MAKFAAIAAMVVGGVILADIITHGPQTAQAAQGIGQNIEVPALNALLGSTTA